MKTKQYAYWNTEDAETPEEGYWAMYDSLEDAVSDIGDDTEIYELNAKPLGYFKLSTKVVKARKSKKGSK